MNNSGLGKITSKYYYPAIGAFLFLTAIVGFSDNLFTDIGQPSNSDPKFIIHGIFALAWFTLIAVQPFLISRGKISAHRTLGVIGAVAAAGLVLTTAYLQTLHYLRNDGISGLALINSIMIAAFAGCVVAAIANRHRPQTHKNLMMIGSFLILEPLASRAAGHLGLSPVAIVPLIWLALFVSLVVRDRVVLGRFTILPFAGFAFLILVLVLVPIGPG